MDDIRFEQISYGPSFLCIVPLLCALALTFLGVRALRHSATHAHASLVDLLWFLPYPLTLCGLCAWYVFGIGSSDFVALVLCSLFATACGVLALRRHDVASLPLPHPTARVLLGCTAMGVCALEFMWNDKWFTFGPQFLLVEALLVGGAIVASWLIGARHGTGPALVLSALAILGLLQHYVLEFRGTSILPSDLFAAGTAMSVSGGYVYGLSSGMLGGVSAWLAGMLFSSLLWPTTLLRGARTSITKSLGLGVGVAALTTVLALVPSYASVFGANLDYWWSKDWYERQGFLPSFIYAWQDLAITEPQGYSDESAGEALQNLLNAYDKDASITQSRQASTQQFEDRMPNILVIQNETFCDLSNFNGLNSGYDGPTFWNKGMPDALMQGDFAVSVFGGGTCNTEFEFLTGNSLAFAGTAKYPFSMYDLSTTSSLARQLGELGYRSVGMHPNIASNWNRDRAYDELGFDDFLSIDDFEGAEEFHTHVSDWATYERSLDLMRTTSEPVFVFDVTMQNHSGYDTGSVPDSMLPGYAIDGLSEDDTFQLNEYLACIEESDHALERLTQRLRELDEPTVVVMYGDHHPWFSAALNDALFPNEDELTHAERIHQTTYVVWANYDVAGWPRGEESTHTEDNTSADLLASMTLDAIGAPLTNYQAAQLGARKRIRAINANGFLSADGTWRPLQDPEQYAQVLNDLALVAHQNFGANI